MGGNALAAFSYASVTDRTLLGVAVVAAVVQGSGPVSQEEAPSPYIFIRYRLLPYIFWVVQLMHWVRESWEITSAALFGSSSY